MYTALQLDRQTDLQQTQETDSKRKIKQQKLFKV